MPEDPEATDSSTSVAPLLPLTGTKATHQSECDFKSVLFLLARRFIGSIEDRQRGF
jgi:hypothetical protein